MIRSHYQSATGCLCVETREEQRFLYNLISEIKSYDSEAEIAMMSAPQDEIQQIVINNEGKVVVGRPVINGAVNMAKAYAWLSESARRILVVFDWHMLCNNAGQWRDLLDAIQFIRQPQTEGNASLVIFVGPSFTFSEHNPLAGSMPILQFNLPTRSELRVIANGIGTLPEGEEAERILDALCGLSADTAEQVCAGHLVSHGRREVTSLNAARRQAIRQGRLEIWSPVAEIGGLGNLKDHVENEVVPWVRDESLAIRRILAAGLPGTGKSYFARWLAHRIGCECARLSIPGLKSGFVGESEANLRRALRTLDSMALESPLVVVLDEIDTVAREGADGGASSGMFAELLTWLQESRSLCIVVATLNRLDKLDAALASRFQSQLFFDLPSPDERRDVIRIHYQRCGCPLDTVDFLTDSTDGYSNRELAMSLIPSIARLSNRQPTREIITKVVMNTQSSSESQPDQLAKMRQAASSLRLANDHRDPLERPISGRRIKT